jgi:uncharacterized membrane protein YhaH (DUF805 family)
MIVDTARVNLEPRRPSPPAPISRASDASHDWLADDDVSPLQRLFDPRGRLSRRGFWLWGVAALTGLAILLHALLGIARVRPATAEQMVNALLLWPALAVSIKRWHDRDRSGWWVLVLLVPILGWLWALVANGFLPGTPGANRYGRPPLR